LEISAKNWLKDEISTTDAPAAVGPYNQAVCAGPLVFVSGQLGIVPGRRELAGPTAGEQTAQALENIAAILDAADSSLDRVVKVTLYLSDINDFPAVNEVYARFFTGGYPARATIQAARLPMGALIEIDAVSIRD
jgi:2-iminobutanoate/2-iminopropanoate deaminase